MLDDESLKIENLSRMKFSFPSIEDGKSRGRRRGGCMSTTRLVEIHDVGRKKGWRWEKER
jgi:hypothetical protein